MPDHLMILSRKADRATALAAIEAVRAQAGIGPASATRDSWKWTQIDRDEGALRINWKDTECDPEDISKLRTGLSEYFSRSAPTSSLILSSVLSFLDDFRSAVGVVADPGFESDESDFEIVWAVCEALDGLVWNGDGLIAIDGRLLLNGTGESEFLEDEIRLGFGASGNRV